MLASIKQITAVQSQPDIDRFLLLQQKAVGKQLARILTEAYWREGLTSRSAAEATCLMLAGPDATMIT